MAQGDVAAVSFSAPSWQFAAQDDPKYGAYWAATPTAAVGLAPNESLDITIANLKAATGILQAQVDFDYYAVSGVGDGLYSDRVTLQQPSQ